MRTLGIRRAAEREEAALDPRCARMLERFCAGVNAAAASRGDAVRDAAAAPPSSSPGGRSTSSASASCSPSASRPTGSGSCCAADMLRALGPELTARLDPTYPADNPVVTQEAWSGDGLAIVEQIDAVRRSIGPRRRGQRLQQLGRQRRAQRHRLAADRRRPPPAAEHAGHLVPGRPAPRRALRPRRLDAGDAGRLHGPEQRRLLDLHQRDGRRPGPLRRADRGRHATCSRTSGGRCETVREEIAVKGRAEPVALEVRSTHHGPIVNEALGADDAEPLALSWLDPRRTDRLRRHVRAARDRLRPGAGGEAGGPHLAGLEPDLGRPPRLDRLQADRPPAAAPRRLPRPAEAGLERRVRVGGDDPLRASCRRSSTPRAASWSPPTTASSATSTRTTSPANGSTASAPSGSSSCWARATSTTSRASRRCSPTTSRCPGSRRRGGSAG